MPVLVETSRGKGRITYLSLDVGRPPLSQWDGLPRFLQNLSGGRRRDEPRARTRWDDAVIFAQLIHSPSFISTYLPTGSLFVAIVGYLIAIGFSHGFGNARVGTRRALVAAFLFFVVFSTCGGYLLFSRGGNIPDGVLLSSTCWKAAPMVMWRSSRTWPCFPPRSANMAYRWNGAGWSLRRCRAFPGSTRTGRGFPGRQRRQPLSVAVARVGL